MVTLRPDHPHSIASARPLDGTAENGASRESVVNIPRRGRRRARTAWLLHQPAHGNPETGGLARYLPSWRYRTVRPDPVPDPAPPIEAATPTPNGVSSDATPGAVPMKEGGSIGRELEILSNGNRKNPPVASVAPPTGLPIRAPLQSPPATVLGLNRPRPVMTELTETQVLPLAHPADGSSLAALLGFGETEASFGGDRVDGNGSYPEAEPVDDPWNRLPPLSAVAGDLDRPGNTGDAVKRLWDAASEMDMDRGLVFGDLPNMADPSRSFRRIRWSLVVSLAVLAALIGVTVQIVRNLPAREAEVREVRYTAAARQLSGALVPIEESLGAEGLLLNDSGLSTLTGQLYALDGAARAAAAVASEELPRVPIIGTRLPADDLVVPRQLLGSASSQALEVVQRIDNAMNYSITLSTAFQLPAVPTEASLTEVAGIAEQLSYSIAKTRHDLTTLPDDPVFGTFRQRASDTVTTVERAQADYIIALRDGDTTRAADVTALMHDSIAGLQEELAVPLAQVQTWAMSEIAQLHSTVEEIESIIST